MKAELKNIHISCDSSATIGSVNWSEGSEGISGSAVGLSLSGIENPKLQVVRVESLCLPGTAKLVCPVDGAKLKFINGQLHVDLSVVKCMMLGSTASAATTTEYDEGSSVLPFPVHLNLEKLMVQSRNDSEKCLSVYPVHLSASPVENRLSIEMKKQVNLRFESSANNWLDACFESSSISLENGTFLPKSFSCGGVCASSSWDASLKIPRFQLIDDGSKEVCLEAGALCQVQSMDAISSIQSFVVAHLEEFTGPGSSAAPESTAGKDSVKIPFAVTIPSLQVSLSEPKPMKAELESIHISCDSSATIGSVNWSEGSEGISGSAVGLSLSGIENPKLQVARVESLHLPGAAKIVRPVDGAKLKFENGQLHVDLSVVKCMMLRNAASAAPTTEYDGSSVLPFPVHVGIEKLYVVTSETPKKRVSIYPVHLFAFPLENRLSIKTKKPVNLRLESSDGNSLDACFESSLISLENGTFLLKSFSCGGFRSGPCSFGDVALEIPPLKLVEGSA